MPLVQRSLKLLSKKFVKKDAPLKVISKQDSLERPLRLQKYDYEKPDLPLYMDPGIIIENFELKKDTSDENYQGDVVEIPKFEDIC